jgi:hypothetical protein
VFENRVLRDIFGPERDEVIGDLRRLHKEELCDLCSSTNVIRVVKSRIMRWAGYVVRMRERRVYTGFRGGGDPRARDNVEDPGVDGGMYYVMLRELC